jgi:hypothetical protein
LEEELDVVLTLQLRVDRWQRAQLVSVFRSSFQGAEYIFLNPGRLHARLQGFVRLEKEVPCFQLLPALRRSPLVLKQLPSTVFKRIQQNTEVLGTTMEDPAVRRMISQGGASLLTRRPEGIADIVDTVASFVGRDSALTIIKRSPKVLSVSASRIVLACTSLQKLLALEKDALASMLKANESLLVCTTVHHKLEDLQVALKLPTEKVSAVCYAFSSPLLQPRHTVPCVVAMFINWIIEPPIIAFVASTHSA